MIFPEAASSDGIQVHHDHPALQVDLPLVRSLIDAILLGEQREAGSLNVVLTHNQVVRTLNEKWLDHKFDTDVLSFALGDSDRIEGEVYVSLDFAQEHCVRFGATFLQETCRYVAHGILHLIGYRDTTSAELEEMRHLEDTYLKECGILPSIAPDSLRTSGANH